MKTSWALKALPFGALTLSLAAGCSGADKALDCEFETSIDSLGTASANLTAAAAAMRVDLATACSAIAGGSFAKSAATDEEVKTECDAANAKIKANLTASVKASVVPGKCVVKADAQFNCEAKCNAEIKCTPAEIDVRCEEGKLSVECSGECTGTLSCEGSATVAANCEGECNGTCSGTCGGTCAGECDGECSTMSEDGKTCAGTCTGTCKGSCSASCEGTCEGSCTFAADAKVDCNATARCEGKCTGTAKAPQCEGTLRPPECEKPDVDCNAGCKGQANLQAECTPPTVVIEGTADADFAAAFEANMPKVLLVLEKGKLAGEAAVEVASACGNVAGKLSDAPACLTKLTGGVVARFEAAASAAVSVQASVSVSASVSTSAGTN